MFDGKEASADELFKSIHSYASNEQNILMGACYNEVDGLITGHAYSILGAYTIMDGNVPVANLVHIRNPWNNEHYTGDWNDKSSKWTEEYKKQVPFSDKDDGAFFIPIERFMIGFSTYSVIFNRDDYQISYYH